MMIFVDGLEEAIVGWANIGKFQIAVYSVDRLSNIIYEDMENEVSTKDVDEIIEHAVAGLIVRSPELVDWAISELRKAENPCPMSTPFVD